MLVLISPNPKWRFHFASFLPPAVQNFLFTVMNDREKQQILALKKLQLASVWLFCLNNYWNDWLLIRKVSLWSSDRLVSWSLQLFLKLFWLEEIWWDKTDKTEVETLPVALKPFSNIVFLSSRPDVWRFWSVLSRLLDTRSCLCCGRVDGSRPLALISLPAACK